MKAVVVVSALLMAALVNTGDGERFVRYYYHDGVTKAEGWVSASKRTGYWHHYHTNGVVQSKGHYKDNMRTDYWYFFETNGIPKREGHYQKGEMYGWWLFYDPQGNVDYKCQLIDGKKQGYCLKYANDQLVSAVKYENGKRIKEWFSLQSFKRENNLKDLK